MFQVVDQSSMIPIHQDYYFSLPFISFNSGKKSIEARDALCKVYGNAAIGISVVKIWFATFQKVNY